MSYKIVITDLEHPTIAPELEVLAALDAKIERYDCRTEEEVIEAASAADGLMVAFAPITSRVLKALPGCSIVARFGIGVDMIDVAAATEHGVVVTNVPDFCLDEVADHTVALLLAVSRKIVFLDRAVREGWAATNGYWRTTTIAEPMWRLSKQTLGIVGLGKIGQRVARRAQAFGMRVIASSDPGVSSAELASLSVSMLPLEVVLAQADFLTLHVPVSEDSCHLIDADRLVLMKPTATVINTSRGPVIDQAALVDALTSGRLGGAGLDVYEQEPLPADDPLIGMDNVVLCSHAAWYSADAFHEMKVKTAQAIVDHFQGRVPRYVLNPAVLSSPQRRMPRIPHPRQPL
ncbi:MAG: C-terminal binding protein [Planctomycetaceae bacterium]|nr:MAG: C-terminal binding protein [Planctomycetaceae bacterium]